MVMREDIDSIYQDYRSEKGRWRKLAMRDARPMRFVKQLLARTQPQTQVDAQALVSGLAERVPEDQGRTSYSKLMEIVSVIERNSTDNAEAAIIKALSRVEPNLATPDRCHDVNQHGDIPNLARVIRVLAALGLLNHNTFSAVMGRQDLVVTAQVMELLRNTGGILVVANVMQAIACNQPELFQALADAGMLTLRSFQDAADTPMTPPVIEALQELGSAESNDGLRLQQIDKTGLATVYQLERRGLASEENLNLANGLSPLKKWQFAEAVWRLGAANLLTQERLAAVAAHPSLTQLTAILALLGRHSQLVEEQEALVDLVIGYGDLASLRDSLVLLASVLQLKPENIELAVNSEEFGVRLRELVRHEHHDGHHIEALRLLLSPPVSSSRAAAAFVRNGYSANMSAVILLFSRAQLLAEENIMKLLDHPSVRGADSEGEPKANITDLMALLWQGNALDRTRFTALMERGVEQHELMLSLLDIIRRHEMEEVGNMVAIVNSPSLNSLGSMMRLLDRAGLCTQERLDQVLGNAALLGEGVLDGLWTVSREADLTEEVWSETVERALGSGGDADARRYLSQQLL